jgi:ubiquinone/menaquinone biosynthesis C-methylase UbiE
MVPDIPEGCGYLLDIGCGAGQTLMVADTGSARPVGVDVDKEALRLGRELNPGILFVRSSGEKLPFADDSFDFVFSRVALPYMNIPRALLEVRRVLRNGGSVWFTLHPLSMLSPKASCRNVRTALFEIYRLANTLGLHYLGRQFRYPLNRNRTESYQTVAGMRRALAGRGFTDIRTTIAPKQFIVSARACPK